MKYSRVHGKSPVRSGWQAIQSSFRSLDWRPKSTLGDARDRASPTISCTGSRYSKSFTLSPSPTSFPNMISYNSGTAKAPIILDEDDSAPLAGRREANQKTQLRVEYSKMSGIYSLMPRQGTPSLQDAILLSATEEDTANKFDPDEKSVLRVVQGALLPRMMNSSTLMILRMIYRIVWRLLQFRVLRIQRLQNSCGLQNQFHCLIATRPLSVLSESAKAINLRGKY